NDHGKAVEIFKEFMGEENEDKCLDDDIKKRKQVSDEKAREFIKELIKNDDPQILQLMNKKERDATINKLKKKDISIRQLARITGIGRRVIEKA
ncbi:MAG: transposase, partial [Bacillota bacterium]